MCVLCHNKASMRSEIDTHGWLNSLGCGRWLGCEVKVGFNIFLSEKIKEGFTEVFSPIFHLVIRDFNFEM